MKKFVFVVVFFSMCAFVVHAQVHVTFRVNMAAKVYNKLWDPAKDSVTIRGSFQSDAGDPKGDWGGFHFKMSLLEDTVYGVTVTFPSSKIGTAYEYKYVIGPEFWEGASNRPFTCPTKDSVLAVNWYNNDSTHNTKPVVVNTVNFRADLSYYDGYFDSTTDSLLVDGIDWDGYGAVVGGSRKTKENDTIPWLFETTLKIKGILGDSCKWKFHFYPSARYSNSGYEMGGDRWIAFKPEGTTTTLPIIIPFVVSPPPMIFAPVTILFECNMNKNPVNAKNGRAIPVDSIIFIGLKGGHSVLGGWGGNWTEADTAEPNPTMMVLHDDGFFGDKVAGDKIYSRSITFPKYSMAGTVEFTYAACYPAAYSDGGENTPLNNERVFGTEHLFKLTEKTPTVISYYFGTDTPSAVEQENKISAVDFSLLQNYPNPFNPVTRIAYSVPTTSRVHVTVFDLLGREVATLVNGEKPAGSYSVDFNAANLPSGIYLYKLTAGSNSIIKKMLLLK